MSASASPTSESKVIWPIHSPCASGSHNTSQGTQILPLLWRPQYSNPMIDSSMINMPLIHHGRSARGVPNSNAGGGYANAPGRYEVPRAFGNGPYGSPPVSQYFT